MAALSPIPPHRALSRCGICGCDDVDVDYLEEFSLLGEDTAVTRVLCECPRCEHRWTGPLWLPTPRKVQNAVAARALPGDVAPILNAA